MNFHIQDFPEMCDKKIILKKEAVRDIYYFDDTNLKKYRTLLN